MSFARAHSMSSFNSFSPKQHARSKRERDAGRGEEEPNTKRERPESSIVSPARVQRPPVVDVRPIPTGIHPTVSKDNESPRAEKAAAPDSTVAAAAAAAAEASESVHAKIADAAEPESTRQTPKSVFTEMAQEWIRKETDWYVRSPAACRIQAQVRGMLTRKLQTDNHPEMASLFKRRAAPPGLPRYAYKPIDNRGRKDVDPEHLEKAAEEYSRRFAFCTEEEDAASHKFSGSPYLLVATNVKSTWSTPEDTNLRFMLVPVQENSALFITFMPGVKHGTIDGAFSDYLGTYLSNNQLKRHIVKVHSGGGTYQPDIWLFPAHPDQTGGPNDDLDPDYDKAYSRVVVEFEFGHCNASAMREVGFARF